MEKIINTILTAVTIIKGFAKYLLIPAGFVLFCPDKYLEQYRLLLEIRNSFGSWIMIIFLVSVSVIIVDTFSKMGNKITELYRSYEQIKILDKIMYRMTKTEKNIILEIFKNDKASLPLNDALVTKLNAQKVIERPFVGISGTLMNFSYCLQPWVIEEPLTNFV
jgi:hypothetical protein